MFYLYRQLIAKLRHFTDNFVSSEHFFPFFIYFINSYSAMGL